MVIYNRQSYHDPNIKEIYDNGGTMKGYGMKFPQIKNTTDNSIKDQIKNSALNAGVDVGNRFLGEVMPLKSTIGIALRGRKRPHEFKVGEIVYMTPTGWREIYSTMYNLRESLPMLYREIKSDLFDYEYKVIGKRYDREGNILYQLECLDDANLNGVEVTDDGITNNGSTMSWLLRKTKLTSQFIKDIDNLEAVEKTSMFSIRGKQSKTVYFSGTATECARFFSENCEPIK